MNDSERLVSPYSESEGGEEQRIEESIRPNRLDSFIGQPKIHEQLGIFIDAATQEMRRLIIFWFLVPRAWAKPPSLTSSQMRWG